MGLCCKEFKKYLFHNCVSKKNCTKLYETFFTDVTLVYSRQSVSKWFQTPGAYTILILLGQTFGRGACEPNQWAWWLDWKEVVEMVHEKSRARSYRRHWMTPRNCIYKGYRAVFWNWFQPPGLTFVREPISNSCPNFKSNRRTQISVFLIN